jgi:hypothetical protein
MANDNTKPFWHCHNNDSILHLDSYSGAKENLSNSHDHLNSKGYESRPKLSNCNNIIQSQATLDFKIRIEDNENQRRLAKATFTYKYFPSDDSIKYMDVKYTHPKLQSLIECNPTIMKNIDSYIRELLLTQKIRT